ncbi:efflux RND transporter permease subunit [Roseomonas sp. SSH11]|uniref:Efflux RND transporter permease subunit n=1 Tax=Pararoseomonas baculiformis TaxID=2820812 RepID=A0ABS4AFG4_9PROT|nr:efflux RND transporter permease subunit [Pararoseomonas baculiformis]MBP0445743.1 efflux RND transporter permease subunit [Pararoseomonas baculiformis]
MNLSAPFIARPIATSLLAIGLALVGLVALFRLPVASMPSVDIPTIVVSASQPGASPETMASTVAAPLERRLGTIPGVTEMTSYSSLGSTRIIIQFDLARTQREAAQDVQAAVNGARQDLPSGLPNPPTIRKINPADAPIMILAMTSETQSGPAVYDIADSLVAQRLAQVPGVAQVEVSGGDQPAVRVAVDPSAIASAGISMEQVRLAITRANVTQATGFIEGPEQSAAIRTNDRIDGADAYREIVLKAEGGAIVRLADIARVEDGTRSRRQAGWFNGRPAILLMVRKQAEANVIDVLDGIRAMIPQVESWVPAGVRLEVLSDRSTTIRASVEEVRFTLIITIALVVAVVAVFLRRWAPILAASAAVPLSLLGTVAVMWWIGYSFNNLSLMALTICVGFVVDDAIVMIENMARHRERGLGPIEAATVGAREIGFTVLSITISLIAVFIPLLAMGGIIGRIFREFSVTLAVAVAISGIVSLTLTPMMAGWMERTGPEKPPGLLARWFEGELAATARGYIRSLAFLLRFRWLMLLATFGLMALTVWLYMIVPKGFLPTQDTGLLSGSTQAAPDTSFATMEALQRRVVEIITADPAVDTVGATVGSGGGQGASNRGSIYITLKPREQRDVSSEQVIARLRAPLNRIAGAAVFLRSNEDIRIGGRSDAGRFSYVLLGNSIEELREWTQTLVQALRQVPGINDVSSDQDRSGLVTRVEVDRAAAARLGVAQSEINATLNNAFSQRQVSTIYRARNQYRAVLEIDPELQQGPPDLSRIFLPGAGDIQVPLSAIARVVPASAPLAVTHQGGFPAASISFNPEEGMTVAEIQTLIEDVQRQVRMPSTIRAQFGGNAAAAQSFTRDMPLLILGAFLAIYVVLGVLYESFIHPVTIISTLPTAGLGALLALLATNTPLTVVALIGVILLLGIVKKNAIMMVDFALEHERTVGGSSEEAILAACRERFRPILMTTLAALLGAVPLSLGTGTGSELRSPLGIAIIGGLVVSQVLTLYTTPVVYLALDRLRWRDRPVALPAPAE